MWVIWRNGVEEVVNSDNVSSKDNLDQMERYMDELARAGPYNSEIGGLLDKALAKWEQSGYNLTQAMNTISCNDVLETIFSFQPTSLHPENSEMYFGQGKTPVVSLSNSMDKMKKALKKSNVFMDTMHPFIFIWRLIGKFPYILDGRNIRYKLLSFWSFYTATYTVVQGVLLFQSHKQVHFTDATFDDRLLSGLSILLSVAHAVNPVTVWFEVPWITKYINTWNKFEDLLAENGIAIITNIKVWRNVALVLMVPFTIVASFVECYSLGSYVFYIAFMNVHINICLTFFLWVFLCSFTKITADIIRSNFTQVLQQRTVYRDDVAAYRRHWLMLSQLCHDLGYILGPSCISFILVSTIMGIVVIYAFLSVLREYYNYSWLFLTALFLVFVITNVIVFSMCEAAQRCSDSVGSSFIAAIVEQNFTKFDEDTVRELNLFLKTVTKTYPDVYLCGYVRISRSLVISIISSAVTYLIVLVQFRTSEDIANNGTIPFKRLELDLN